VDVTINLHAHRLIRPIAAGVKDIYRRGVKEFVWEALNKKYE